jgi:hypothetical protein
VSGLLFVTVAREDREARILGEMGIGEGKIAEEENGIAVRFDLASVDTVRAETGYSAVLRSTLLLFHQRSIAQDAVFALAEGDWSEWGPGSRTP